MICICFKAEVHKNGILPRVDQLKRIIWENFKNTSELCQYAQPFDDVVTAMLRLQLYSPVYNKQLVRFLEMANEQRSSNKENISYNC